MFVQLLVVAGTSVSSSVKWVSWPPFLKAREAPWKLQIRPSFVLWSGPGGSGLGGEALLTPLSFVPLNPWEVFAESFQLTSLEPMSFS